MIPLLPGDQTPVADGEQFVGLATKEAGSLHASGFTLDGVLVERHAKGGIHVVLLCVGEPGPFLPFGQQSAGGQARPEQERRAVADQRDDLAAFIEGRDQLVQDRVILEGQQWTTATSHPNRVVVVHGDVADGKGVLQRLRIFRVVRETQANEVIDIGSVRCSGGAVNIEHHFAAARGRQVHTMGRSVERQKARVVSSAKKPTGEPLSWAVLETIDRMRRALRFTLIRVWTLRSEAGMEIPLLGGVAAVDEDGLASSTRRGRPARQLVTQ